MFNNFVDFVVIKQLNLTLILLNQRMLNLLSVIYENKLYDSDLIK